MLELESLAPPLYYAPPLRVFELGRFEIEQGDRVIDSESWKNGKARSLFKILLSRRNFQISRQEASALLWPELEQDRAANNLNQAVYSLRRTLEPDLKRASDSGYLKTEGSKIHLNQALIGWVDVDEFKRLYLQAQLAPDIELYEQASELYRGDYLPEDLYEDWSIYRREALRQDWAELLIQLAVMYQAHGQEDKYQRSLHRVLESDFSHEWAVQRLMQALAENGRREESLTLYRTFAAKMQSRLNMEPLSETQQLYNDINSGKIGSSKSNGRSGNHRPAPMLVNTTPTPARRRGTGELAARNGAVALPSAGPSIVIQAGPSVSLPLVLSPDTRTPLPLPVGREAERQRWLEALDDAGEWRAGIMALVGEPGIGKTNLAQSLMNAAGQRGRTPLSVSCYPEQSEMPFGALADLLEQGLSQVDGQELQEGLKSFGPGIFRVLPGLSYLLPGYDSPLPDPGAQGVFVAVAQALAWLNRRKPLALVLENIQYLPGPSLRLLRYLRAHPGLHSLPILVTLRPAVYENYSVELAGLVSWIEETGQPLCHLERLSESETGQLLAGQLGAPAGSNLLSLIYSLSRGNPRVTLELLGDWRREGRLRYLEELGGWDFGGEKWSGQPTPGVMAFVRRVVNGLSQPAQVLLNLMALGGPEFSFDMLRRVVLERPDGAGWWIELDRTKLGTALTEITASGLVEEYNNDYRFVFPLLPETLVVGMPNGQRRCWNEVIAWARGG